MEEINRKIERPCYGSKDKYRLDFMNRNCEVVGLNCDGYRYEYSLMADFRGLSD